MKIHSPKLPILFCVLLSTAICGCNSTIHLNEDNLAWKTFDDSTYDQSIDLGRYASPNLRDGQDTSKLVIVCASGGGSRAAAFNIGIMLELETIASSLESKVDHQRNVLNEVDYFSTVSGGGWGVSSFIAYKFQEQRYSAPPFSDAIRSFNSSLTPTDPKRIEYFPTYNSHERYLSNRADFRYFKHQVRYIFEGSRQYERSDRTITNRLNSGYLGQSYRVVVEQKLNDTLRPQYVPAITLGDVFKAPGVKPTLPMMITNTTNIDNYKLVPITPDRLSYWGVTETTDYFGNTITSNPASLASYGEIPLATGTKSSGGIPFLVTPATFTATKTDIHRNRSVDYFLHLQDGGIIDQQAMHSAKAILRHHKSIKDGKKRIVFIIDASGSGIENQEKFRRHRASRFYNLWRVIAPFSTPDSQYALTRERIKLLEDEYNCTVVYLGTEVLLDESLFGKPAPAGRQLPTKKETVRNYFNSQYALVRDDRNGFKKFDMKERELLYSFISTISTAFSSKNTDSGGKFLNDLKETPRGTANIMFLAGRGVVQLKREKIEALFR